METEIKDSPNKPFQQVTDIQETREFLHKLKKWGDTQDIQPVTSKDFFINFQYFISGNRVGLLLEDPEGKKRYILTRETLNEDNPSRDKDPEVFLHIRDPKIFLTKLEHFRSVRESRQHPWANEQAVADIWHNATPDDFEHPEAYIDKVIKQIEDSTFEEITDWKPLGYLPTSHENLFVKHIFSRPDMEAPHEFRIILGPTKFSDIDELPAVRYGITSPDTAIIYAIQMPTIDHISLREIEAGIREGETIAIEAKDKFITLYNQNKSVYITLAGDIPQDIQDLRGEEFVTQYLNLLKKRARDENKDVWDWIRRRTIKEELPEEFRSLHYLVDDNLRHAKDILEKLPLLNEMLDNYNLRKEKLNGLTPLLKGGVPEHLRNAPPAFIISFITACSILKQRGITNILIPTQLPLRRHDNWNQFIDYELTKDKVETGEQIDARIHDQILTTAQRAAYEVDGLDLISFGEGDHYIKLKMWGELSTNRPVLKEIITAVNKTI